MKTFNKIIKKSNKSFSRIKNSLDKKMMDLYTEPVIFQSKDPLDKSTTHPIRMSPKTWKAFRKLKRDSGKNWDRFIEDIIRNNINK